MLQQTVVEHGCCIGCGACSAAATPGAVRIELNELGMYQPTFSPRPEDDNSPVLDVCPFTSSGPNEDVIAEDLFGSHCQKQNEIGYYAAVYAGCVSDKSMWSKSSSGGLARWLLRELLARDVVDHVIHVEEADPDASNGLLFRYAVTSDPNAVLNTAKSAYYPIELSGMLKFVAEHPGRYAVTGVPCFVKAIRRLGRVKSVYRERILYCIGIICGHLKSTRYAEMMAWQMGVEPDNLQRFDFRVKIPGKRANQKGVAAADRSRPGEVIGPITVQECFGTQYPHGFFKYPACNFCDDVVAETADVSIGDAWLPEYLDQGTSLVIVRNLEIDQIIKEGMSTGSLELDTISPEKAAKSQAGGLRDRRTDLKYRLYLADQQQQWRPEKRVTPEWRHLTALRRRIVRARLKLSTASHVTFDEARKQGNWSHFLASMRPMVDRYDQFHRPFWKRLLWRLGIRNRPSVFSRRRSQAEKEHVQD